MDVGAKLKMIHDLMHKDANNMLEEVGLTFQQHHVLIYIARQVNKTATLKELEKTFHVAQASMAGVVKRLELKDLIHSYYSEDDKRVKYVTISDKGLDICKKSYQHVKNSEQRIELIYTKEEFEQFNEYLDRLYQALKQNNPEKIKD